MNTASYMNTATLASLARLVFNRNHIESDHEHDHDDVEHAHTSNVEHEHKPDHEHETDHERFSQCRTRTQTIL